MASDFSARECAAAAFRSTLLDWRAFLRANWAWGIIGYVIQEVIRHEARLLSPSGVNASFHVFYLILGAPIAVGWHRHILVGEQLNGLHTLRFGIRQARFLVTSLMLFAIATVPIFVFTFVVARFMGTYFLEAGSSFGLIIAIPAGLFYACWVWSRTSLALPMIALDVSNPLRASWEYTRGRSWHLFLSFIITILPLEVPAAIVTVMASSASRSSSAYIAALDFVSYAIFVMQICLGAAAISFAYRKLAGPPAAAAEA